MRLRVLTVVLLQLHHAYVVRLDNALRYLRLLLLLLGSFLRFDRLRFWLGRWSWRRRGSNNGELWSVHLAILEGHF